MGRKRRHRDSSQRILKKLERELRKRRRRSYSSSDSDRDDSYAESANGHSYGFYYEPSPPTAALVMSDADKNELEIGEQYHVVSNEPSTSAANQPASNLPPLVIESDKNELAMESVHLDDEILNILGDAPKEESPMGQEVHSDIASRLRDILLNGLKKETKEKIIEDYPVPANCPLFKAPVLNAEVKAAVSDILQKKDDSLVARQAQVGTALTALTRVMDILVTDKSETNQVLLKHVNNACRLLCDSHYIDTKMRRNFLISTLNNKLKETLKESKRDQKLFGEALSENLIATKAINKSSLDLKSQVYKPKVNTKNSKEANSSNHLNWRRPQPNQQNMNRRATTTSHRTAGSSTATHRNETTRKPSSGPRAHRTSAHYRNQKRS